MSKPIDEIKQILKHFLLWGISAQYSWRHCRKRLAFVTTCNTHYWFGWPSTDSCTLSKESTDCRSRKIWKIAWKVACRRVRSFPVLIQYLFYAWQSFWFNTLYRLVFLLKCINILLHGLKSLINNWIEVLNNFNWTCVAQITKGSNNKQQIPQNIGANFLQLNFPDEPCEISSWFLLANRPYNIVESPRWFWEIIPWMSSSATTDFIWIFLVTFSSTSISSIWTS